VLDAATLRRFAAAIAVIFIPLFVLFVAWRWHYFGRLLPLPFLKKGGGTLHWDGLAESMRGGALLLGWAVLFVAPALRSGRSLRWTAALAVVCGGFLSIWVFLSGETNYFWRFQYALLPIVASSWWGAAGAGWEDAANALRRLPALPRRRLTAAGLIAVAGVLGAYHLRFRPGPSANGLMTTGLLMHRLGGPARRLVTTEAGLLPLYSEWHTVDAWGLNDARIVSDGTITEAYLSAVDPDVIMFHGYYTPLSDSPPADDGWSAMVVVLHRFARCHGYTLAAAFAPDLSQAHYYFVKPAWAGAEEFTRALRATPYAWSMARAEDLSAYDRYTPACGQRTAIVR
jgi:hypothetical protein